MLTFGNKLNRMYTLFLPFMDDYCEISVLFNKSNSFTGFNLDQRNYVKSRSGEIKCSIFSELDKSAFATSFLDLRNYKSRNLDIRLQFNNILPEYKDKIHYESNETVKLSKITTPNGKLESCLYIYVFKLTDLVNDFLFCLAERQHIDIVLDRKVVRTSAIQLCTNSAYEDISLMIEKSNRKIVQTENIDSINIFQDRKNVKDDIGI